MGDTLYPRVLRHIVLLLLATSASARHLTADAPPGFEWRAYVRNYPDLHSAGIASESEAMQHWLNIGAAEDRLYRPVHKLVRYTACTGLFNQYYSHVAALALAATLQADVIFPPAATRSSYQDRTSLHPEHNEARWQPVAAESLWNVRRLKRYWKQRGMHIHLPTVLEPFPDIASGASAFQLTPVQGIPLENVVRMEGTYIHPAHLDDLAAAATATIMAHAKQLYARSDAPGEVTVLLDLPCTFFALHTPSAFPLVQEVVHSLGFAPLISALARRVIDGVSDSGALSFDSMHLRMERDAEVWAAIMGGQDVVWEGYTTAMATVGFNATRRVYVASALLTYGAADELRRLTQQLKQGGFAGSVHFKEQYLPRQELAGLHSEQVALLDFIVCAAGDRFVGFGASTFSFFMREYRLLHGKPRATSALVDASAITTDPLFYSAGLMMPYTP